MVIDNLLVYTIILLWVLHLYRRSYIKKLTVPVFLSQHLATGYPGVNDPIDKRNMINSFLDWAQQQQNVWIVTNRQLLAWVRNPVPVSVSYLPKFSRSFFLLVYKTFGHSLNDTALRTDTYSHPCSGFRPPSPCGQCHCQQLNSLPEFGCQTPKVTENICNGMVSGPLTSLSSDASCCRHSGRHSLWLPFPPRTQSCWSISASLYTPSP